MARIVDACTCGSRSRSGCDPDHKTPARAAGVRRLGGAPRDDGGRPPRHRGLAPLSRERSQPHRHRPGPRRWLCEPCKRPARRRAPGSAQPGEHRRSHRVLVAAESRTSCHARRGCRPARTSDEGRGDRARDPAPLARTRWAVRVRYGWYVAGLALASVRASRGRTTDRRG